MLGYQYLYPDGSSLYYGASFSVDGAVELSGLFGGSSWATVDISDTNVLVDYFEEGEWPAAAFNGFRIFDISDTVDPFTSVTINAATNLVGLDASRITFDANSIYVNWQGLPFTPSTVVSLDLNQPLAGAVPEPASILLVGTGLAGAGGRRWRRRYTCSSAH